ncbi:MAG: hypothetical protein HKN78_05330 [Sphingomonadaceae bacterium]|nr:hypothetical protein [Sphingomonadaceae bacterium]
MARIGPRQPMSLIQATITFVVAFFAINVVIDILLTREIQWLQHVIASLIAAPIWYFFIRWMRSRRA